MNEIVIKQSGCVMVLYKNELYQLPQDILVKALKRGKGLQRIQAVAKREAKDFDRWQLYETLKGNRFVDDDIINTVEVMDIGELREGLLEYLIVKQRQCKTVGARVTYNK